MCLWTQVQQKVHSKSFFFLLFFANSLKLEKSMLPKSEIESTLTNPSLHPMYMVCFRVSYCELQSYTLETSLFSLNLTLLRISNWKVSYFHTSFILWILIEDPKLEKAMQLQNTRLMPLHLNLLHWSLVLWSCSTSLIVYDNLIISKWHKLRNFIKR